MSADPTRMAVLLYSAAGMYYEIRHWRLNYVICDASRMGQVAEAQDARIEQKRWAGIAAERQYAGYQLFANRWKQNISIS